MTDEDERAVARSEYEAEEEAWKEGQIAHYELEGDALAHFEATGGFDYVEHEGPHGEDVGGLGRVGCVDYLPEDDGTHRWCGACGVDL